MKLEELGKNIFNTRKSLGMTQEEVAFELDISITAYAKIERGETNVGFLRLAQIAELFKTPITKLVSSKENDNELNKTILAELQNIKDELKHLKTIIEKK